MLCPLLRTSMSSAQPFHNPCTAYTITKYERRTKLHASANCDLDPEQPPQCPDPAKLELLRHFGPFVLREPHIVRLNPSLATRSSHNLPNQLPRLRCTCCRKKLKPPVCDSARGIQWLEQWLVTSERRNRLCRSHTHSCGTKWLCCLSSHNVSAPGHPCDFNKHNRQICLPRQSIYTLQSSTTRKMIVDGRKSNLHLHLQPQGIVSEALGYSTGCIGHSLLRSIRSQAAAYPDLNHWRGASTLVAQCESSKQSLRMFTRHSSIARDNKHFTLIRLSFLE